jgi:hypothetical protein
VPNLSIPAQYPNFDDLLPLEQWALLSAGVVSYAKEIIRALELAATIADANGLAALIAATPDGAGVAGSTELTRQRAEAIMAMTAYFLEHMATPLEAAGGLTPKQILYRYWPRPTASA